MSYGIKYYLWKLLGVLIGGLIGFLFGTLGHCSGGGNSCPLTSNPWMGILWGATAGFMFVNPKKTKTK